MAHRNFTAFGLATLWLTACAATNVPPGGPPDDKGFDPAVVRAPAACRVHIFIDRDGHIVIDHEPIRAKGCEEAGGTKRALFWILDASRAQTFGSIKYTPTATFKPDCRPFGMRNKVIRCTFERENDATPHKYGIEVINAGKVTVIDPIMIN
jgi:hypothetical protein